jgi:hypothetical protein
MRHHFHLLHIVAKKAQMVLREQPNARAHIHLAGRRPLPSLQQGDKTPLLNEVKKLFLGRKIVVESRQAHFRRARDIPHRGAVKSFRSKNFRRCFKDLLEFFVVMTGSRFQAAGHGMC